MSRVLIGLLTLLGTVLGQHGQRGVTQLTYRQRLEAQREIERIYYSHQVDATRPFEQALPDAVLERRVRTHLSQSVALAELWRTPVTSEALEHEWQRIARNTRFPDRLREIQSALGGDRALLLEALVRPVLVDRLARNFFAWDTTIHAGSRLEAEGIAARLASGELDLRADHPRRMVFTRRTEGSARSSNRLLRLDEQSPPDDPSYTEPGVMSVDTLEFERLRALAPARMGWAGPVVEERDAFTITGTLTEGELARYVVPKRSWDDWWQVAQETYPPERAVTVANAGVSTVAAEGPAQAPLCLEDDTWDNGALDDMPEARHGHTAVWTGSLMLIYGGQNGQAHIGSGARYDPLTDTWSPISSSGAPPIGRGHSAVWTGTRMIVWGGLTTHCCGVGGSYDPIADVWLPIAPAPLDPRDGHTAVWTGSTMIVWGGGFGPFDRPGDGAIYDPVGDRWSLVSDQNAPTGWSGHSAVWTGSEMIVWGGSPGGGTDTGARFDPVANTWSPMSTINAPQGRQSHSAVWTGREMIVWGGYVRFGSSTFLPISAGRYDPVTDTWTPTTAIDAPAGRYLHSAIWTGSEMIIWGGSQDTSPFPPAPPVGHLLDGKRYDPLADRWIPINQGSISLGTAGHSTIWTGDRMIVWGGVDFSRHDRQTGARYEPGTDAWTPTSDTMGGPPALDDHTAIWTGTQMIVWGVTYPFPHSAAGGRYDPLTDAWAPMSTIDSPTFRYRHAAVWTGSEMIIWGGVTCCGGTLGPGGRYDPMSDSWSSISTVGAPPIRDEPLMVWTGEEAIVWGGGCSACPGGLYEPASDTWRPMASEGAPEQSSSGPAVWTGKEMIVWGGIQQIPGEGRGGRYNPQTNTWVPTSVTGAPWTRTRHTAVWTGTEMIIWGGTGIHSFFSAAGRYNPTSDSWSLFEGLPSTFIGHSAIWTGDRMLVWGGLPGTWLDTGQLYDPITNTWTPASNIGAPLGRSDHTAIWTGSTMLIWGGHHNGPLLSGGRYARGHGVDDDHDGYSECQGDCADVDAATHPGAPQVCGDRANNDCMDPHWPALTATNEADDDGDSFSECLADCDDASVSAHPGAAETCNGLDDDCDGAMANDEADADADGFRGCQNDCDDSRAAINPSAVDIPGNTVDENCDGRVVCDPTDPWKNRGQLVQCVARECAALAAAGLLSSHRCGPMVREMTRPGDPVPRPVAARPERPRSRTVPPLSPAPSPP